MPRANRVCPGGIVYHALNRGNQRDRVFDGPGDYAALEGVLAESVELVGMRLLAYAVLPNHWHMLLYPRGDGDLPRFMHHLTTTHVRRWRLHRHSVGEGHVYQGTYKSFPVARDEHFLSVARYIERNPLRAGLVAAGQAAAWRWSSLWRRVYGTPEQQSLLSPWPVDQPGNWVQRVNQPQTQVELEALRLCVRRGRPYGPDRWVARTAEALGLGFTLRDRGRPKKERAGAG